MKVALPAALCLLALPLKAQESTRSPRPRASIVMEQNTREAENLKDNIAIRLHGTTTTGDEVDLSISGIGPKFSVDQAFKDDTMLTCQYVVSITETGYSVSYTVSKSIKCETNSTEFHYRNITTSGTILCSLDRPQVLVRNGSKTLQLTITREAEPQKQTDQRQPAPRPGSK